MFEIKFFNVLQQLYAAINRAGSETVISCVH